MQLQQHPLSAAFPAMDAEDFQALKDSIEQIGVQNPITLFEGMVIDGWHRYTAANELHLECPSVELDTQGWIDPREFVIAQNKARRHVTKSQLAMATTAVYEWRPNGGNQSALSAERSKTSKELAAMAGVGVRSIEQAKAVQTKAVPEVSEAVQRGEIGLKKASEIAKLPKEEQAEAITKPLPRVVEEQPLEPIQAEDDYTEADALRDQVLDLQAEVARLKLLVPDEADEGKAMQDQLVKELRDANALIDSLTVSRDRFQAQLAEAVKQCEYLQRKIKKAGI